MMQKFITTEIYPLMMSGKLEIYHAKGSQHFDALPQLPSSQWSVQSSVLEIEIDGVLILLLAVTEIPYQKVLVGSTLLYNNRCKRKITTCKILVPTHSLHGLGWVRDVGNIPQQVLWRQCEDAIEKMQRIFPNIYISNQVV